MNLNNVSILIENEQEYIYVQNKLLNMGYIWKNGENYFLNYYNKNKKEYLNIDECSRISYSGIFVINKIIPYSILFRKEKLKKLL